MFSDKIAHILNVFLYGIAHILNLLLLGFAHILSMFAYNCELVLHRRRLLPRDKGWKTYHQRWYVPIRKGLPFTLCLCGWFRRIIFRRVPIQGFESILQVGVQKDFAFAKKKRDSPVTG